MCIIWAKRKLSCFLSVRWELSWERRIFKVQKTCRKTRKRLSWALKLSVEFEFECERQTKACLERKPRQRKRQRRSTSGTYKQTNKHTTNNKQQTTLKQTNIWMNEWMDEMDGRQAADKQHKRRLTQHLTAFETLNRCLNAVWTCCLRRGVKKKGEERRTTAFDFWLNSNVIRYTDDERWIHFAFNWQRRR